jgi:hypothetical protein
MKMIIDFEDAKAAEFLNKETGETINYKVFAVDFGNGAKYMSMNKIGEAIKALKIML